MRVFGCLAYYRNTETNGDKFEPRGKSGVFLGYPTGKKGYKIFNLEQRKMVITKDVKLIEDVFPFSKAKSKIYEQEIFDHLSPISQCDKSHDEPAKTMETAIETEGASMQDNTDEVNSLNNNLTEMFWRNNRKKLLRIHKVLTFMAHTWKII